MTLPRLCVLALMLCVLPAQAWAEGWPVTHRWNEKARPNDPSSGSFAYEYQREAVAMATSMTASGTALDCADMAITILAQFAAKNGLEVVWTMPDPARNGQVGKVSSTEARFTSPAQFARWSRNWINAQMVATLNTSPVSQAQARGGDVVMMRWNQLGVNNPFPGRDVWHTYFLGDPGKLIFYGNIEGEDGPNPTPLAIVATSQRFRIEDTLTSPAIYGTTPRRWNLIKDAIVPPAAPLVEVPTFLAPKDAKVTATALNVRSLPSTHSTVLALAKNGESLRVEGKTADGQWVRVRRADGSIAYVSAQFVTIGDGPRGFHVSEDWTPPSTPSTTTGINGVLGTNQP
ncbi:MAG: SH3 domain-containing protein [Planctomycetota bacterium]